MARNQVFAKLTFSSLAAPLLAVAFLQPNTVFAQDDALVLEEIIVTAQRREQSLMEVPLAIEVFSGNEIRRQGFRDLDDLANFSPTVLIETRVQDQDVSIRGVGTTGNTLTHDQAAPFFVDGLHYGRQSQVNLAFLDVASVEVLKGPQPVYFGQNATAGAFNVRSRRPTDTWQGYVNVEVASDNTSEVTFAVGGPINDQWGIRVAGAHEETDGYLIYAVTGDPLGGFKNDSGRLMLTFEPNDNLSIMAKVDGVQIEKDTDTHYTCLTGGPILWGEDGVLSDPGVPPGNPTSVFNQDIGTPWAVPFIPLDTKCFDSNVATSRGGPYFDPVPGIRCYDCDTGMVDMRLAADAFTKANGGNGIRGYADIDAVATVLEAIYTFDNGMSLEFLGGTADYERDYSIDNRDGPFFTNLQNRGEDFSQWSTELRLRSAGDRLFEWELGGFFQHTELEAFSSSLRANLRQSQRMNFITEDVDFSAVFANVTINFSDRFSLDIGGRYQDVDKFATVRGYGASWVFDVCPENPCDVFTTSGSVTFDEDYAGCEGSVDVGARQRGRDYCLVDPSTVRFFGPAATPGALLYAMPWRETRDTPDAWSIGGAVPVGLTAIDFAVREDRDEAHAETFLEDGFSPQVSLRFRASDDLSIYARYAESFKIGGFDTGQSSIPRSVEELTFQTEDAEHYELGVKGVLMDGRFGFDASIFETDFPNLQVSVLSIDPDQTSASGNAGQRVRGLEFNTRFAASENWILGFAGAFLDGEMTRFPGAGCTDGEVNAAINNGAAPCQLFDEDTIDPVTGEPVKEVPTDADRAFELLAIIDRTGLVAPRTPDWKFILSADFVAPIGSRFEFTASAKAYISDEYILDVEGFEEIIKYDQHEDLNIMIGLSDVDAGWALFAFARNLLEARPTYHPENDPFPQGTQSTHLPASSFTSYGVKMEYLFD